mmetsp:Transcript_28686/g.68431  ORF Transcript_28686/g.68431 Transcript_28686/m.68431 type:complete len:234 (+) Transcript_28686:957-1658(+)
MELSGETVRLVRRFGTVFFFHVHSLLCLKGLPHLFSVLCLSGSIFSRCVAVLLKKLFAITTEMHRLPCRNCSFQKRRVAAAFISVPRSLVFLTGLAPLHSQTCLYKLSFIPTSPPNETPLLFGHRSGRDNRLSGTLPRDWSVMSFLEHMDLEGNRLSGTLPADWSEFHNIAKMELDENSISGVLPPQWSKMTSLKYLFLKENKLTGTLPPEWSALENIKRMYAALQLGLGGWK